MAAGKKSNKEEFTKKANDLHNHKFDYSLVEYKNAHTKVKIICPIHGEFEQQPSDHLNTGGCKKCGIATRVKNSILGIDLFIKKANKIHNGKYDYSLANYVNSATKIEILCPTHGSFYMKPNDHLHMKQGCALCATGSFKKDKPAILYYIKDKLTGFYKIGITNRTVEKRFQGKNKTIKIIKTWIFKLGNNAFNTEQALHSMFKKHQVINENYIHNGSTEFFKVDVLNLEKKETR